MHEQEYSTHEQETPSDSILDMLRPFPQFVVWKYTIVDGKPKKPPFDPKTGQLANPTNRNTWSSLEQAQQALKTGMYNGLGFVFSEDDPFTGIDIDHCVLNNHITPEVEELITDLWSYTELSPSHTGLHILVAGTIPEGRRKGNIEMYSTERYFTLTTNHLKGSPETIEERQTALDRLYARLTSQPQPREHSVFAYVRDDDAVLKKAMDEAQDAMFIRLFNGDTTGFTSKSNADFTFILKLLYWCNNDVDQVRKLFLKSGLVDEKTLSRRGDSTYLDVSIENALKKRRR